VGIFGFLGEGENCLLYLFLCCCFSHFFWFFWFFWFSWFFWFFLFGCGVEFADPLRIIIPPLRICRLENVASPWESEARLKQGQIVAPSPPPPFLLFHPHLPTAAHCSDFAIVAKFKVRY